LKTEPIKIEVGESDRLANQDIAVATSNQPSAASVETSTQGIFANITDPHRVIDQRVRPDAWFLSLGSMAVVFIVCSVVTKSLERRRNDPVYQRRRTAGKKASAAVAEARRLATQGNRRETVEALSGAMTRLVADSVGTAESGLTARDVARELDAIGVSKELVARSQKLLDELDATRYGDGAHQLVPVPARGGAGHGPAPVPLGRGARQDAVCPASLLLLTCANVPGREASAAQARG